MAVLYANRGYVTVSGQRLTDIKRIELKVNRNAKQVPTMTPDLFSTGFVVGNFDIDITFEIAVEDQLSSPKLELINWSTSNGSITVLFGNNSDNLQLTGLFLVDSTTTAPAPGEEVGKVYTMKALKIIDNVGASSLFNSSLFAQG